MSIPIPQFFLQNQPIFLSNKQAHKQMPSDILGDISQTGTLLNSYIQYAQQTNTKIDSLLKFTVDHQNQASYNHNVPQFFALKNMLINKYLVLLKFYEIFRLNGIDMSAGKGLQLYQKLFYYKTILMKLGPIDKKLEYQRDKILSRASRKEQVIKESKKAEQKINEEDDDLQDENLSNSSEDLSEVIPTKNKENSKNSTFPKEEQDDQLMYRPNISNLLKSKQKQKSEAMKDDKYIAPKLASALPGDQKHKKKIERQRQRKKAMILRRFRGDIEEVDDAEQIGLQNQMDNKYRKKYEQKLRIEEQNKMRFPQTKKEKQWKKQMMKNQFRGHQLNDQFKQVELIRQLIEDQTKQGQKRPSIPHMKAQKKRKYN